MDCKAPIGLKFSILQRAFRRRVDAMLAEKGLTSVQLSVLGQLDRLKRGEAAEISQRDLEKAAKVSHSTMADIIKRLEKKGFVAVYPSEDDRRCKRIEPTELAGQLGTELSELDEEVFSQLCAGMSQEQICALRGAIDIMLENVGAFSVVKGCDKDKC